MDMEKEVQLKALLKNTGMEECLESLIKILDLNDRFVHYVPYEYLDSAEKSCSDIYNFLKIKGFTESEIDSIFDKIELYLQSEKKSYFEYGFILGTDFHK